MMTPSLEEVKQYAGEYRMVPVKKEMFSDLITPMEVMRKLKKVSSHCYMPESLNGAENWGRYTFLGYDPKLELTCLNGEVHITKDGRKCLLLREALWDTSPTISSSIRS